MNISEDGVISGSFLTINLVPVQMITNSHLTTLECMIALRQLYE